jgi:hypothetical protein
VSEQQIDQKGLRGVDMLHHLPMAVGQFDCSGTIMQENAKALHLFGPNIPNKETLEQSGANDVEPEGPQALLGSSNFMDRFVDQELGARVLAQLLDGERD